jgi:hypothetical protein
MCIVTVCRMNLTRSQFAQAVILEQICFDVDQFEVLNLSEITSQQIFTHSRQLDFPRKYFLYPDWRKWVQRLADKSPVVLVTAPRHSRMRRLADSYLTSYMSDEFTVISV